MEDGSENERAQLLTANQSDYYDAIMLESKSEDSLLADFDEAEDRDTGIITSSSEEVPVLTIVCILSTAFSYGCICTTLFMITLPIECERIHQDHPKTPTAVCLGIFVAIAGITQLVTPVIGRLSDMYQPPALHELGQRMPYLVLGSVCTCIGLFGQLVASYYGGLWMRYGLAFFLHMIGLNIMYSMVIALIPDQIPRTQTGIANGLLALQLVLGSLFGFGLFHSFLYERIQNMYGLYICLVIFSSILTGTHAHDRDAEITFQRIMHKRRQHHTTSSPTTRLLQPEGLKPQQQQSIEPELLPLVGTPTAAGAGSSPNHHQHHDCLREGRNQQPKWKRVAKKAAHHARKMVLTPTVIIKSILVDPLERMDWIQLLQESYFIDTRLYHDFYIVTVSRLFYYSGMSVQTFFLYFVQDVVGVHNNPEAAVATLAILGQCAGAVTCYPVGYISDYCCGSGVSSKSNAMIDGGGDSDEERQPQQPRYRRIPFVYLACAILSTCTALLVMARTMHQMVVFCLVLGAANGIYLTMDTSLAVDTLPEEFEGDSGSAQLLGVWGVAAFLGATLGPMIGGPLLYLVGYKEPDQNQDPNEPSRQEYSLAGYAVLLSLSSTYFLLSALTLRYLKHDDTTSNHDS